MLRVTSASSSREDTLMPLVGHLRELRRRLLIALAAIVVGGIAGFALADPVFRVLSAPIAQAGGDQGRLAGLNFTAVSQAFDLRLQIAFTVGVVVASPVWLYQVWRFLVPGLLQREKRYALSFLAAAAPLFLVGCAAGWLVLPHIVELMLGFATAGSTSLLDARSYCDFALRLLLATGVAFVIPVFLVVLNAVGVLSARAILKGWRVAILAIATFAAFATPAADMLSMVLLAVPMIVLYFSAVGVAFLIERRRAKAATLSPAEA